MDAPALERRAGLLGLQAVRPRARASRSPGAGPACCRTRVEPGWVATKMGGPGAPDDLALGSDTQAWLAASADPDATVTGRYFYHRRARRVAPAAARVEVQDGLLAACEELTGVAFPDG